MKVSSYVRVSSRDQNCALQRNELAAYAARMGYAIAREYADLGWSGAKDSRPALDELLRDAMLRKFDCLLVWTIDRFGRSVSQLVQNVQRLDQCGIRFIAISQGLDTDRSSPTSRLLLHILASVAEFERELICERIAAGRKRYAEDLAAGRIGNGVNTRSKKNLRSGRPWRIFDREKALEMRAAGVSIEKIARDLNVGHGTIQRLLAARCNGTPQ